MGIEGQVDVGGVITVLQFFSIGLAHFLKPKSHSQNNMDKPLNHLAVVPNRI